MAGEYLVIERSGRHREIEPGWGPAVMLVAPVVDALKRVENGFVVGPVDRDTTWAVEAFALAPAVVEALGVVPTDPGLLHQAVVHLGFTWQAHPT